MKRVWLLMLVLTALGWAEPIDLAKLGVYERGFQLVGFTPDGKLLGLERTRTAERKQGVGFRLWVLQPGAEGREVPLIVPSVDGVCATRDGAVVMTQAGTTFLEVDLATARQRVLMSPSLDGPGFVGEPGTLERVGEKVLVAGSFYAAGGQLQPPRLTLLDPTGHGFEAFAPGPLLGDEKRVLAEWSSPEGGFTVQPDGGHQNLVYRRGKSQSLVLKAQSITGLVARGERALVTLVDHPGQSQVVLVEGKSARQLSSDDLAYGYPLLSDDGAVAVVCQLDVVDSSMRVLVGRKADGYRLTPLEKLPLGQLQLAPDGSRLAYLGPEGLQLFDLTPSKGR
ncbi:MAG: hypothetical protein KC910_21160 [Candidatus Eremiobacteraeota bacterium]|nr:hypothetical protein [Candidatus Eremiobacteraeota bacterium]